MPAGKILGSCYNGRILLVFGENGLGRELQESYFYKIVIKFLNIRKESAK